MIQTQAVTITEPFEMPESHSITQHAKKKVVFLLKKSWTSCPGFNSECAEEQRVIAHPYPVLHYKMIPKFAINYKLCLEKLKS